MWGDVLLYYWYNRSFIDGNVINSIKIYNDVQRTAQLVSDYSKGQHRRQQRTEVIGNLQKPGTLGYFIRRLS